jgi:glycogen debranching enzyme
VRAVDAYVQATGDTDLGDVEARHAAGQPIDGLLTGLTAHLRDHGLGSVSEGADGDPPHAATGCPFLAWSVAELLRVRGMTLRI